MVDEIVFAVNMQELARLEPVMQHCADVGMRTRVQLEFLPAAYSRIYLEKFREVQLLSLSSAPDSELRLFFKRIFDVALSFAALIVFSPVLLCIAAMIRMTSPGPVPSCPRSSEARARPDRHVGKRRRRFECDAAQQERVRQEPHQVGDVRRPARDEVCVRLRSDPGRHRRRRDEVGIGRCLATCGDERDLAGPRTSPAATETVRPCVRAAEQADDDDVHAVERGTPSSRSGWNQRTAADIRVELVDDGAEREQLGVRVGTEQDHGAARSASIAA